MKSSNCYILLQFKEVTLDIINNIYILLQIIKIVNLSKIYVMNLSEVLLSLEAY